ncbi:hypothetical protein BT96DRAFT_824746, partial [Gymnopus androsaceus JB14]
SCKFIHGLLLHTPDMYLDEIQQHLDEQRGVLASISTICRVLKCSGYTLKKVFDCSLHLAYLMLFRLQKLQLNAMS